ncbi:MAG: lysophospholipid acyltransferase family protein [Spirochaetia bacterium]
MKLKISVFFQSPANVFLFRHMSPRIAQSYLHSIGRLYYLINRKDKRVIEKNVREVLHGQDEGYVRKVVRETFKGIFTHYFEKMFSAYLDYGTVRSYVDRHFKVEGAHLLTEALEQGKGCILVTTHWGAVEFIPWVLHTQGVPTSVILECATAKLAKSLGEKVSHTGTELISSEHCKSVFLRAMQSLKANRVLMTQCDEVDAWRRRRSHTISLFGKELFFDNTIDVLAHRSGAPVVAAFLKRTGGHRYTLILEDVSVQRAPQSTARDCLSLWEKYVSQYPEQWYQWKKWSAMKAA